MKIGRKNDDDNGKVLVDYLLDDQRAIRFFLKRYISFRDKSGRPKQRCRAQSGNFGENQEM